MREVGIRVVLDKELRRAPFAAEARVDTMENLCAAGDETLVSSAGDGSPHCFLRTGAGSAVFSAASASEIASFVPSMASSSVSR